MKLFHLRQRAFFTTLLLCWLQLGCVSASEQSQGAAMTTAGPATAADVAADGDDDAGQASADAIAAADAGASALDSGASALDSGASALDSGASAADSGATVDASGGAADAGGGQGTSTCKPVKPGSALKIKAGFSLVDYTYDNKGKSSKRQVAIQAPQSLQNKKYPLFFAFHGSGGGYKGFVSQCKWAHNGPRKSICIVPVGGKQIKGGKPGWNIGGNQTAEDDLSMVRSLWAVLKEDPHVDLNHVYAYGTSMGSAFVANVLAPDPCVDFLGGIGNMASPLWQGTVIKAPNKLKVVIAHGAKDKLIPVDGGKAFNSIVFYSISEALKIWAKHNSCLNKGQPVVTNKAKYKKTQYTDCSVPMVAYRLHDNGHNADTKQALGISGFALMYDVMVKGKVP